MCDEPRSHTLCSGYYLNSVGIGVVVASCLLLSFAIAFCLIRKRWLRRLNPKESWKVLIPKQLSWRHVVLHSNKGRAMIVAHQLFATFIFVLRKVRTRFGL